MRFELPDVAERVLDPSRSGNAGSGSALDSPAVDVEAHVAGEDLEALLLGWMEVPRDIAAGIGEHLGAQDVALAGEREALAADWIADELGHDGSFYLGFVL
jgi:hypothetical protein